MQSARCRGFVRDLLLGRNTHDLDLAVEPLAIPFAEQLQQLLGGQIRKHEQFGTAELILHDGQKIDMVTARQEFMPVPPPCRKWNRAVSSMTCFAGFYH